MTPFGPSNVGSRRRPVSTLDGRRSRVAAGPRSSVLRRPLLAFSSAMALGAFLYGTLSLPIRAQTRAALSNDEDDKIRAAQDPSARIGLFLDFGQARLMKFDTTRSGPADPQYDTGTYLDQMLGQYIALTDEMKDWIQYQHDRGGDMRAGLRELLKRGPEQLDELRHAQQNPDSFAAQYSRSLHDAIDDVSDALDGAAKALTEQEKKLGQLKQEQKVEARDTKARLKEEKKRSKQEKKLRKREHEKGAPSDQDME